MKIDILSRQNNKNCQLNQYDMIMIKVIKATIYCRKTGQKPDFDIIHNYYFIMFYFRKCTVFIFQLHNIN